MIYQDESGFTLLEVVVSLSVISLCLILLSLGVRSLSKIQDGIETDRQIDWHLFVNQFEHYVADSQFISLESDYLLLQEDENNVEYRMLNGNFIRRVNSGTQQLLMNVDSVQLERYGSAVDIRGIFSTGEQYQSRIWVSTWNEDINERP